MPIRSANAVIAGVMGWPVGHSRSPRLHNYWLDRLGMDGAYIPMPVRPELLVDALKALPVLGMAGCNLTVPHKEEALAVMDTLDEAARVIGAVNTVAVREGKLHGSNTDAHGFITGLFEQAPDTARGKAVVLGAGGAARAVAYALKVAGFSPIVIVNRTVSRAKTLAQAFHTESSEWGQVEAVLKDAALLVNTTTLGMDGHETLTISLDNLPVDATVADIVYTPLETALLAAARARGNACVDGLSMLIHQAAAGFHAWFGQMPPVTAELREWLGA